MIATILVPISLPSTASLILLMSDRTTRVGIFERSITFNAIISIRSYVPAIVLSTLRISIHSFTVISLNNLALEFVFGSESYMPLTSVAFTKLDAFDLSAINADVALVLWPGCKPPAITILLLATAIDISSRFFGTCEYA